MRLAATLALLASVSAVAGQPPAAKYPRGEKMVAAYFRDQVKQIDAATLTDLTTREAWEKKRPELRRQFLDMMGLWPLPAKTDLKATVTGKTDADAFTVEKLHFQSMPGLYVTANLYLPKTRRGKLPAVLYVCGHGNVVENGVSFGSKVFYQYHPAWFASNGFACLALDTLELAEIPGEHHGTSRRGMWWWQARGYTPAGIELWNGVRALDYLQSRPEVDPDRIGLTGRSGGGATSWWVAAADERVRAVVPVAGIADLEAHLCEGAVPRFKDGVISGHCDCMYFVNTHRWDFATVAALIAPRPLLLGNSDVDDIFPVQGYRRIARKVEKVYALYDAPEKFELLETKGPHKDTPDLHAGINKWLGRWLRNRTDSEPSFEKPFKPAQLKVFDKLPEGRVNESIHDVFIKPASPVLPANPAVAKEWWRGKREEWTQALRTNVFGGWAKNPPPLKATIAADVTHDGVRLRAIDFVSENAVELRMFVMTSPKVTTPAEVILSVLDERGWERWCGDLGPAFADALQLEKKPKRNDSQFAQNRRAMEANNWAFAAVAPRGVGVTKWADAGSPQDTQTRRRFALVGQTLDGQKVWDARRAVTALRTLADLKATPLTLQGEGDAAGVALYASLFEPSVHALDLWRLPPSHHTGPTFLNVLRHLDTPQAVALAGPRRVTLHLKDEAGRSDWAWVDTLQRATGEPVVTIRIVGE